MIIQKIIEVLLLIIHRNLKCWRIHAKSATDIALASIW